MYLARLVYHKIILYDNTEFHIRSTQFRTDWDCRILSKKR